jgi:hypothetical protein
LGRIKDRNIGAHFGGRNVEHLSNEPFVKEPDAARIAPRWPAAGNRLHAGGADGEKEALEHGEVQAFVLQCESEMAFECRLGFISGRVKAPLGRIDRPVTATDSRELAGQRNERPGRVRKKGVDQGCIASRGGSFGKRTFVKNRYWT